MSLTNFLDRPEVTEKFKPLRPKLPRKISSTIKAEPRSNRHTMLGTAFDYFLRFELNRRAPHALAREWVAERAPNIVWLETDSGAVGIDLLAGVDFESYMPPDEVASRARKIVRDAKADYVSYLKNGAPTRAQQADLAVHAIRLAKLDEICRARRLDPRFEEADQEDIEDLLALLALVPFDSLIHPRTMLLNPTFESTSSLVRGADTDLITGDMLVDFKTTKRHEMQVGDLDQLLGYYLLARHQRKAETGFPVIKRLALYFSRHGFLWLQNTTMWTDRPEFSKLEEWFFKHASEVFKAR